MNNEDSKKQDGNTPATYLERFHERLNSFPSQVGKRNPQLLGLVNYGVRAGMTDDKIEDEIINGSGEPPLSLAEIRHALETARKSVGLFKQNATKTNLPPPLGPRSKDYVPDMMALGVGATEKSLTTVSPVAIPDDPLAQTKLFLSTLYTDTEFVFVGDKYDNGILGKTVQAISNWKQSCPKGPYLIINPLMGTPGVTKTGKPSYRCTSCISSLRYILVEADDATLDAQWAFWAGVISSQTLPLRSLVYSGNNSLHGIVEIAANNAEEWRTMQKKVMFAVAHPSAPRSQKADEACNNVDRLTRLAGATHPETKKLQRLLWLSHKPLGIN